MSLPTGDESVKSDFYKEITPFNANCSNSDGARLAFSLCPCKLG